MSANLLRVRVCGPKHRQSTRSSPQVMKLGRTYRLYVKSMLNLQSAPATVCTGLGTKTRSCMYLRHSNQSLVSSYQGQSTKSKTPPLVDCLTGPKYPSFMRFASLHVARHPYLIPGSCEIFAINPLHIIDSLSHKSGSESVREHPVLFSG